MDSAVSRDPEGILRRRLSDFVTRDWLWHRAIDTLLKTFRTRKWTVFIFGGTLRDLLALTTSTIPRDLDLVVAGVTQVQLQREFSNDLVRVNRFGGLRLLVHRVPVDIWPLESTWAFRQGLVGGGDFADLPRTTFLNVEAVAAELDTRPGRARTVYGNTFFRSLREQVLEINLEENPYPGLCVVRSLVMARKLDFSLGPRLTRFIAHHGTRTALEEMEAVQLSHYGHVRLNRDHLHRVIQVMSARARSLRPKPVMLPREHQLGWNFGQPAEYWHPSQLDWYSGYAKRKKEKVLHLLNGEEVDALSHEQGGASTELCEQREILGEGRGLTQGIASRSQRTPASVA